MEQVELYDEKWHTYIYISHLLLYTPLTHTEFHTKLIWLNAFYYVTGFYHQVRFGHSTGSGKRTKASFHIWALLRSLCAWPGNELLATCLNERRSKQTHDTRLRASLRATAGGPDFRSLGGTISWTYTWKQMDIFNQILAMSAWPAAPIGQTGWGHQM